MTKISKVGWIFLLLLVACDAPPSDNRTPQLKLPKPLTEISGLALLDNGDLLAVADERAIIYRIRFEDAEVKQHSHFGKSGIKGDFEGIAVHDEQIYIITSEGALYRQNLTSTDGEYSKFDTGLKKTCEIEGLAHLPDEARLVTVCKTPYRKRNKERLLIYAWSVSTERLDPEPWLSVDYADLGLPRLHPSGISFTSEGNPIVVAARQKYYAIFSPAGELLNHGKLPNPHVHRQTEGVVVSPGNTLYLADEGQADRGTLTRYERFF